MCLGAAGNAVRAHSSSKCADTAIEPKENKQCYSGKRSSCCRSTKVIGDCIWSGCQGSLSPTQNPKCPSGYYYQTYRYNKPEGVALCREEYVSPVSGKKGTPLIDPFKSALCCRTGRSYSNCNWANDPSSPSDLDFCFDPPSTWYKAWPVDRDRVYELGSNDADTDKAIWQYDNQYESNHREPIRADGTVPEDSDAYGFMVLNGEEEAMDANFKESHTVVWRTVSVPRVKRDILTKNQPVLERASEHMEETFQVYCNVPPGAEECETV
ncbi:hypothetical protein CGLO_17750 [Colletotrichum gloeosporioides Cg-14]|uniref:Uncharacterized protein n=1 Tax=Colletotrichum gloeosporioides (strain Cg-14) TaxID=1237896 RepID=T0JT02_COLGC|nr:hypothetical protein CGLO_17750 [Colletotrichum gloeosporioides Cg-14]